ncbi:MAG: hypothetical protein IKS07_07190 [Lachnospiraceae bacterium]|nr:hypothetical protein [Lachnospiraceae bacterium]
MKWLAILIGESINYIIGGAAAATVAGFIYTRLSIKKLQDTIDEKKSGGRKEYTDGGIKKTADVYTWEGSNAKYDQL